ncbi:MAG: hypothetical protein ISN29_02575 [Gammaproteobacteria bacterium AqS3]|nr:hypothetical protein [Gammaproteobacteria bacterium AqS3]
MIGQFKYIDKTGKVQRVGDSMLIPEDAAEIVMFHVEPPPPPHSEEDHRMLEAIDEEFARVYELVYGNPPCLPS